MIEGRKVRSQWHDVVGLAIGYDDTYEHEQQSNK
jgi:hypothetical protein